MSESGLPWGGQRVRILTLAFLAVICVLGGCGGGGGTGAVARSDSGLGAGAVSGGVTDDRTKPQGQAVDDRPSAVNGADDGAVTEWELPPAPPVFE